MTANGASGLGPPKYFSTSTDDGSDEVDRPLTAIADEDFLDEIKKWESQAIKRPLVLVTAGKPGAGKSTLINNFLGLEASKSAAKTGFGFDAVTKNVDIYQESVHGVTVRVVDTPGFESQDAGDSDALANLILKTGGKADLLLYCLSLASRSDRCDERIVQKLTKVFGKKIWKNAILVLTFGDMVLKKTEDKAELLKRYTEGFQGMLEKADVTNIPVSPILSSQDESSAVRIVGVPVGEELEALGHWGHLLFREVIKKCDKDAIPALFELQGIPLRVKFKRGVKGAAKVGFIGSVSGGIAGAGIGGAAGAAIGGALGAAVGGMGALPGTFVGAGLGTWIGAIIGMGGMGGVLAVSGGVYHGMKPKKCDEELTEIKKILKERAKRMAEEKKKEL